MELLCGYSEHSNTYCFARRVRLNDQNDNDKDIYRARPQSLDSAFHKGPLNSIQFQFNVTPATVKHLIICNDIRFTLQLRSES